MRLFYIALTIAALPLALTAAVGDCTLSTLGKTKCDATNTSAMHCESRGWNVTETCYKAGACHEGPSSSAYCDKPVECTPGESQCDAARHSTRICTSKGVWAIDRKCAKFDCCEMRDGKAVCKSECGPGMPPPAARDFPSVGDYCQVIDERYCEFAHDCILKCGANHVLFLEQCCKGRKCYYDNASLEPFCA